MPAPQPKTCEQCRECTLGIDYLREERCKKGHWRRDDHYDLWFSAPFTAWVQVERECDDFSARTAE